MGPTRREDDVGPGMPTRGTPFLERVSKIQGSWLPRTLNGVSDLANSRGQTKLLPESREAILPDGREGGLSTGVTQLERGALTTNCGRLWIQRPDSP